MRYQKRFLLALAVSFALHFIVISGPGWYLPSLGDLLHPEDAPPLEAYLAAPPAAVAAKPVRPKPKRPRPPAVPAAPVDAAAPVAPPVPPPDEPAKVSDDGTPPAADDATDVVDGGPASITALRSEIGLPRFVHIRYRVSYGESHFAVGVATQELRQDGAVYSVRSSAQTTGIVSLFRPAKIVNISEGDIIAGSLRPREFRIERNGGTETARFDWDAGSVRLPNGRDIALPAHTQDMVSMFCQLALVPTNVAVISMPVLTSKVVERYDFTVLGEEKVRTPWGVRKALHLRNTQSNEIESTEVWLGLEDARLPIKIQHTDRKGEMFEQIAESIEFDETKEGTR
jgi:hypothetical protein